MTDSNMIKGCQYCGEALPQLRSDAKYCSSKCRNDFNNLQKLKAAQEREAIVGEAHAILWKNRNILLKYVDQTVSLTILQAVGFKTNNITRFQTIEEGRNEFLVYDVWYQIFKTDSDFEFKIYQK